MLLPLLLLAAVHGPAPSAGPESRVATDPRAIVSAANSAAAPVPIEDLFFSRSIAGPAWSPDSRTIVFTTNTTGRFNLWTVPAAGGWPVQLMQSDDRQTNAVWSPDGKWIVWQQDKGGGEYYDLYAVPATGGEPVDLTHTPDVSETGALFSPRGNRMAFGSKTKSDAADNVSMLEWSSRQVTQLTHETSQSYSWRPVAWSADGRFLYANRGFTGGTDGDVYRITVADGHADCLTTHEGKVVIAASALSPDGRTLLVTSNEQDGYRNVALLDVATHRRRWVTRTHWEAMAGDFAPDGRTFTYALNEDGRTSAFVVTTATLATRRLPLPPGLTTLAGTPSAYSPDGRSLLVSHQSSRELPELWVVDLATLHPRQLTRSAIASLDPGRLPAAQLVHYQSVDGLMISAFLWMPFNHARDGAMPGVVLPHGGPTGQTPDVFNRTAAVLASRGYACIAPNVRGSTGYGLAFQMANHQDLGGKDLDDEVAAAKFLVATGYVDAKRIGITGGSYGGYMTLMAVGKTPDVWAAGVEEFGIIDWLTMLQHEDPSLQEYEKSLLGDPDKDRAVYEATSPIKYLRNAKAPLLVLQGENDIRVPKEEAEQVVKVLKDAGRTVDAHFYPAEGHGFAKRENQIDSMNRMLEWFEKYLKPSTAETSARP